MLSIYSNLLLFWAFLFTIGMVDSQYYGGPAPQVEVFDVTIAAGDLQNMVSLTYGSGSNLSYPCSITWRGTAFSGASIKLHGQTSRGWPKLSFTIKFPKSSKVLIDYWNYTWWPQPEKLKELLFVDSWVDPTFLANKMNYDISMELGGLSCRSGFGTLSFNGQYYGLYSIVEHVNSNFLTRRGLNGAGNLYSADNHTADWWAKADPLEGLVQDGGVGNGSDIAIVQDALTYTPTTYQQWEQVVRPLFNLTDVTIYNLVMIFSMTYDVFNKNYYAYHDYIDNYPMRLLIYDAKASYGSYWNGTWEPYNQTQHLYGHASPPDALSGQTMKIPEYFNAYMTKFRRELTSGVFTVASLTNRIDYLAAQIAPYVDADTQMWQAHYWAGRALWSEAILDMKLWVADRHQLLLQDIIQSCQWDECGVCNGQGAPCESHVRLTEIMFNGPVEFLEIKNVGNTSVLLDGYEFTSGVFFHFTGGNKWTLAPGEFVVLTNDPITFKLIYPNATVGGQYMGSIKGSQQPISIFLVDINLQSVTSLTFEFSLNELCTQNRSLVPLFPDPTMDEQNNITFWRWSSELGGSPGRDEINNNSTINCTVTPTFPTEPTTPPITPPDHSPLSSSAAMLTGTFISLIAALMFRL